MGRGKRSVLLQDQTRVCFIAFFKTGNILIYAVMFLPQFHGGLFNVPGYDVLFGKSCVFEVLCSEGILMEIHRFKTPLVVTWNETRFCFFLP